MSLPIPPNITYQGDTKLCQAQLGLAQNMLYRLRMYAKTFGRLVQQVEGGYIEVMVSGKFSGIFISCITASVVASAEYTFSVYRILSGVVRGGTLGGKALDVFQPTAQCAQYVMNDSSQAGRWNPNAQLASPPNPTMNFPDPNNLGTQAGVVRSGMYTGKMRTLVQIMLGYGYTDSTQTASVDVLYDFRFLRSHGIVKAASGNYWVVEVSQTNGVVAMPLPLNTQDVPSTSDAQDLRASCAKAFGGIPTGGGFPVGAAMASAIAAGTVLQLLSPSAMNEFFQYQPISGSMGWSFNQAGSEAHNTCYSMNAPTVQAFVYKLAFNFPTTGTPTATLTQEQAVPFPSPDNYYATAYFWDATVGTFMYPARFDNSSTPLTTPACIMVGHDEHDNLFHVYVSQQVFMDIPYGSQLTTPIAISRAIFTTDSHTPPPVIPNAQNIGSSTVALAGTCCVLTYAPGPTAVYTFGALPPAYASVVGSEDIVHRTVDPFQLFIFPEGYRDGYSLLENSSGAKETNIAGTAIPNALPSTYYMETNLLPCGQVGTNQAWFDSVWVGDRTTTIGARMAVLESLMASAGVWTTGNGTAQYGFFYQTLPTNGTYSMTVTNTAPSFNVLSSPYNAIPVPPLLNETQADLAKGMPPGSLRDALPPSTRQVGPVQLYQFQISDPFFSKTPHYCLPGDLLGNSGLTSSFVLAGELLAAEPTTGTTGTLYNFVGYVE